MIIERILYKIQQHNESIEGNLNYTKWIVTLSYKELKQFIYDARTPIDHVIEIDRLEPDYSDDLIATLNAAGLRVETEPEPTFIYLHKSRS